MPLNPSASINPFPHDPNFPFIQATPNNPVSNQPFNPAMPFNSIPNQPFNPGMTFNPEVPFNQIPGQSFNPGIPFNPEVPFNPIPGQSFNPGMPFNQIQGQYPFSKTAKEMIRNEIKNHDKNHFLLERLRDMSEEQAKQLVSNNVLFMKWIDQPINEEDSNKIDDFCIFLQEINDNKSNENKDKAKSDDDDKFEYDYDYDDNEKEFFDSNPPNKETSNQKKQKEEPEDIYDKYEDQILYIGNLDETVTDKELKEIFSKFGKIKHAKIMRYKDGKSKHFGYICYEKKEFVEKSIQESTLILIHNRQPYVTKEDVPSFNKGIKSHLRGYIKSKYPKNYSELLQKLRYMTDEQAFELDSDEKLFMEWIEQPINKEHSYKIDDFCLFLQEIDDNKNKGNNKDKAKGNDDDDNKNDIDDSNKEISNQKKQKEEPEDLYDKYKDQILYIGNFGENINEETLKLILSQFGEIKHVKIMRYKDGKSKGFGYICYETKEQAEESILKSAFISINDVMLYVSKEDVPIIKSNSEQEHKNMKDKQQSYQFPLNNVQYQNQMGFPQIHPMILDQLYSHPDVKCFLRSEILDQYSDKSNVLLRRLRELSNDQAKELAHNNQMFLRWINQ